MAADVVAVQTFSTFSPPSFITKSSAITKSCPPGFGVCPNSVDASGPWNVGWRLNNFLAFRSPSNSACFDMMSPGVSPSGLTSKAGTKALPERCHHCRRAAGKKIFPLLSRYETGHKFYCFILKHEFMRNDGIAISIRPFGAKKEGHQPDDRRRFHHHGRQEGAKLFLSGLSTLMKRGERGALLRIFPFLAQKCFIKEQQLIITFRNETHLWRFFPPTQPESIHRPISHIVRRYPTMIASVSREAHRNSDEHKQ